MSGPVVGAGIRFGIAPADNPEALPAVAFVIVDADGEPIAAVRLHPHRAIDMLTDLADQLEAMDGITSGDMVAPDDLSTLPTD